MQPLTSRSCWMGLRGHRAAHPAGSGPALGGKGSMESAAKANSNGVITPGPTKTVLRGHIISSSQCTAPQPMFTGLSRAKGPQFSESRARPTPCCIPFGLKSAALKALAAFTRRIEHNTDISTPTNLFSEARLSPRWRLTARRLSLAPNSS